MADYVNTTHTNESRFNIVYADLVFDRGCFHSSHQAYCVFEEGPVYAYSPNHHTSAEFGDNIEEGLFEKLELLTDEEPNDSSSDTHSYLDMELETELYNAKHRCRTSTFGEGPYSKVGEVCQPPKPIEKKERKASHKKLKLSCTGMVALNDGRIAITTRDGKLLIFGLEGKFLFQKEFTDRFEDITTMNKTDVAATCGCNIKIFTIGNAQIVELPEKCIKCIFPGQASIHGIHFAANQFYISCKLQTDCIVPKPLIRVYDLRGGLLKTFEIPRLASPKYVVCSADGKHIFLTDQRNRTIVALDQDGSIKWEATDLSIPKSLTIVGKNRIVVASEESTSFKCFSFSGKMIRTIDTEMHKSCSPFLIFYHSSSNKLLFCPEKQTIGARDSVFSMKLKKSKRKRLSSLLFPFAKE
ncbi:uncharacterized protein LOC134253498 [Saccostrea cucullata]|uniref:uncharacterized protein LOC134253498 n=1 Tax=Saccostrea cuccullata TaxID=36930 RepID=UPI002ED0C200